MASPMKIVKLKQTPYYSAKQLEESLFTMTGAIIPKGHWLIYGEDGNLLAIYSPEKMLAEFDFIEIPPAGVLN